MIFYSWVAWPIHLTRQHQQHLTLHTSIDQFYIYHKSHKTSSLDRHPKKIFKWKHEFYHNLRNVEILSGGIWEIIDDVE